ncbi:MAG: hypothetical protein IKB41_04005 [Clostridia bacterium]|nr:hypothetical protein [Clostridia bacterium]
MAARRGHGLVPILQIALIVALTLLLISILFFEMSRTATELRREAAGVVSVGQRVNAVGYVFRDEAVVESVDTGPVAYAVANGAAVTGGCDLAVVYADGSNTGTRARAAEIVAEIERLQALDDPDLLPDYYGAYETLMGSLSAGTVLDTEAAQSTLQAALDRYAAQGEAASERSARIAALQAEFEALIENDRNATDRVKAPCDGIFYRNADGYEAVLSVAAVQTLTPGGLRALLASPQSTASAIGKVMTGDVWYLAVPLGSEAAEGFTVEKNYKIDMLRTGESMTLILERITPADTAGEVLLIFRAKGIAPPRDLARCEEVAINTEEISGIWVPMTALRENEGMYTVFVDDNGVAATRKIEPLLIENGYCLASVQASAEFLQEGERILVTARHIYEGKTLK